MRKIKTEEAVGMKLGTDITNIVGNVKREVAFKRGHIIEPSDISVFLSIGRHYVWVESCEDQSFVNEDEAAKEMMQSSIGEYLSVTEPSESRVKVLASCDGVLIVNKVGLKKLNSIEDVSIASKKHLSFVRKGTPVAIGKVMPNEIPAEEMHKVKDVINEHFPIFALMPLQKHNVALFPVGNEFIEGRRTEVISLKIASYLEGLGQNILTRQILPDEPGVIIQKAREAISNSSADLIVFIGGMAVDPDDRTVESVELLGAEIIKYGIPIWPGQNIMIAYLDKIPIIGLPSGAGLAEKNTGLHRIVPIILANYKLSREEIIEMGEGGFIDASNL
jgi:molybdopterin biosynthesis enzyme